MMEAIQSSLGSLPLKSGLPEEWNGHILRGSEAYTYQGPPGEITLQLFQSRHFSILYTTMEFRKRISLLWKEKSKLRFQYMLKGTLKYSGQNEKQMKLRAGHLNVVWAPNRETSAELSKGMYEIFQIEFQQEMVQELFEEFPTVRIFAAENLNQWIGEERMDDLYGILDSTYSNRTLEYFYKTRAMDQLLKCFSFNSKRVGKYSEEEVERIFEINRLILDNPGEHYTTEYLAGIALMNEGKLARLFNDIIGVTIFERSLEARMEKAKEHLLIGDTKVDQLHKLVGYRSFSGFLDAFKKRYRCTPHEYREQFRPKH